MDNIILQDNPLHKWCNRCQQFLPATPEFFYRSNHKKDGLFSICKECQKLRTIPRYEAQEGFRRCKGCNKEFPLTTEFFYADKGQPQGLGYTCKQCVYAKRSARYQAVKQLPPKENLLNELTCIRCGKSKPATEQYFYRNIESNDGFHHCCIECRSLALKQDRVARPEAYRKKWQKYEQTHKAHIAAYRQANQEHFRACRSMWYQANLEHIQEQRRQYRQTERGKIASQVGSRLRKARDKGAEGRFTSADIRQQFKAQKGKCYYCHKKLDKYHIDHIIPLSRGGTNWPDNIVLSCAHCNLTKNNKLPHEWPEGNRLL